MSYSILVVDDEPMARQLLHLMLRDPQYEVSEAIDGYDAIEKVEKEKPDLVIMDVMMPGIDGYAVCRHLRTQDELADLPIILLSAKTHPSAINEGYEAGATKYLFKPTLRSELLEEIARFLP